MSEIVPILEDETGFDRLLLFTLPSRNVRGRLVRLGPVLEEILAAHDYPIQVKRLLAEALALTALIGGLLKNQGSQLTIQAQAEGGAVALLVCDYREGALRGYAQFDAGKVDRLDSNPSLEAIFGKGHLAMTFDVAETGLRYQGIVPLEGASLNAACEAYFARSEQVPTLIRLGVDFDGRNCVAGGLLVQHLAEGEAGRERLHVRMDHPEWEHVAILAESTRHAELVDPGLSLEALVWRLFHEEREVRVEPGARLARGCRCSIEHYRAVLGRFPEQDLEDMRDQQGLITVDCAFCSRLFEVKI
ncbi:MAG TPA: Hsp33 family molecular chaperone HslO [Sphingomonadaceae bacterium]|nr:Hsp33 family molecular chaperone HslO [Sphingomonadaceae bacterium]